MLDFVRNWLRRPQRTNGDALLVGVIGGIVFLVLVEAAGRALDAAALVEFEGTVPIWALALVAAGAVAMGYLAGMLAAPRPQELQDRVEELEARTAEVEAYDVYAEHINLILDDLRKMIAGALPVVSLGDLIEKGIFEPAQRLLARSGERGDIRFSVLHLDPDDPNVFVMANDAEGLFPALGHSLEGRQKFRLEIDKSFSGLAYRRGRPLGSGDVANDERFEPHPKATRPYASIYSVPLRLETDVDGVLNVVATAKDAFSPVDRTYIRLLGAVTDAARATMDALKQAERASDRKEVPPIGEGH